MKNIVTVGNVLLKPGELFLIAGPCVMENEDVMVETASELKSICADMGIPYIFKSSFDKANRTSIRSFRGPGIVKGLEMMYMLKSRIGVPVISDIHTLEEVEPSATVLDALQIPAFLCRQTDLVLAASKTGKPVNIKKGQFLAPWDMKNIVEKFTSTGNHNLFLTERGVSFGYNNLVVDFRTFPIMRSFGYPVIFDVTHSLQLPGGRGNSSGGQREYAEIMARAAVAAGVDGLFMEVHPAPDEALCDGPNMISLDRMRTILSNLKDIHNLVRKQDSGGVPS